MKSVTRMKGGSVAKRTGGLGKVSALISKTAKEQIIPQKDPLKSIRRKLKSDENRIKEINRAVADEIDRVVSKTLKVTLN
jgi:hypothetical protein